MVLEKNDEPDSEVRIANSCRLDRQQLGRIGIARSILAHDHLFVQDSKLGTGGTYHTIILGHSVPIRQSKYIERTTDLKAVETYVGPPSAHVPKT
jgi:hypothetical protein